MIIPTTAQEIGGCIAPTFPESNLNLSDGAISNEWPNVETYVNLTEFGTGGFLKFSHNTTHIFTLIGVNDKSWVAIEFEPDVDNCMVDGHDTWVFYIDQAGKSVDAVDATMRGIDVPEADVQNDLAYEATFQENFVYIEVVRAFDTLDTNSYDVPFMNGTEITMLVASNNDHMGSRTYYYLCVVFSDDPENFVPNIDLGIDWNKRKDILFYGGLIFAAIFILTHITMRLILYPLKHPNSIVDSTTFKSPTIKDRLRSLKEKPAVNPDAIIKMEETDQ
jgi:hypothetical protein